jgi:phage terminase small subunit
VADPHPTKMTPQQQRFVEEYMLDLNGTQAAIRAGYTQRNASVIATQLLSKPLVHDAVQVAEAEYLRRAGVRALAVLQELTRLGFSDITHYAIDDNGDVALAENAPPHAMRAVSSIKKKIRKVSTEDGEHVTYETEIKLWNKNDALDKLGQHLKLFGDKSVSFDLGVKVVIEHRDRLQLPEPIPGVIIEQS